MIDVAAALACGLACGFVIGLAWHAMAHSNGNPYGDWLARTCWVRPYGHPDRWRECVVVAVSWAGAVCVRDVARPCKDGYWIKKQNVAWRVRWEEPRREDDADGQG